VDDDWTVVAVSDEAVTMEHTRTMSIALVGLDGIYSYFMDPARSTPTARCGFLQLHVQVNVAADGRVSVTPLPPPRALAVEVEEQREKTANAERALAELQERERPRTITPDAHSAILAALKRCVPDDPIDIDFISGGTNEPAHLAYALADILKEAKWTASASDGGPAIGRAPVGLIIIVADVIATPERAELLKTALDAGGLAPRLVRSPNTQYKPGAVLLRVGLKR
jgi:hypothetical protein